MRVVLGTDGTIGTTAAPAIERDDAVVAGEVRHLCFQMREWMIDHVGSNTTVGSPSPNDSHRSLTPSRSA